jgi:hypothetical protein
LLFKRRLPRKSVGKLYILSKFKLNRLVMMRLQKQVEVKLSKYRAKKSDRFTLLHYSGNRVIFCNILILKSLAPLFAD